MGDEQHVKAESRRLLEQTAAPNNALVALLSAVPFGCAAAVMLLNAKHSQATGGSPADNTHACLLSHREAACIVAHTQACKGLASML